MVSNGWHKVDKFEMIEKMVRWWSKGVNGISQCFFRYWYVKKKKNANELWICGAHVGNGKIFIMRNRHGQILFASICLFNQSSAVKPSTGLVIFIYARVQITTKKFVIQIGNDSKCDGTMRSTPNLVEHHVNTFFYLQTNECVCMCVW